MTIERTWTPDERFARMAAVLATGVRNRDMQAEDALRVLRHRLRLFNRNRALKISRRSVGAQEVIARYAAEGMTPPKNGSPDALHADHVFPLTNHQLQELITSEQWLAQLGTLREVVCVTAHENEQLRQHEAEGAHGWSKYPRAGVTLLQAEGDAWVPFDLLAAEVVVDACDEG